MSSRTKQTAAQKEYADNQNEVLDWYDIDATEQYVDLDRPALRTHILEAGSGDPVLLLHGLGDVAITWSPLLTRLQTDFSLYAQTGPVLDLVSGIPGLGRLYKFMQSRLVAESARDLYQNGFNGDVSKFPDAYFEAYATEARLPGAAESFISFFKNVLTLRGSPSKLICPMTSPVSKSPRSSYGAKTT